MYFNVNLVEQGLLKKGKVRFFDPRSEKRFGFILTEDGRDLFFHFNQGLEAGVGNFFATFSYEGIKRNPRPGDEVVFEESYGKQGIRAGNWCFLDDYNKVVEEIIQTRQFRAVKKRDRVNTNQNAEEEVEFITQNEEEFEQFVSLYCAKGVDLLYQNGSALKFERRMCDYGWQEWEPSQRFLMNAIIMRCVRRVSLPSGKITQEKVVWGGSNKEFLGLDKRGFGSYMGKECNVVHDIQEFNFPSGQWRSV